MLQTFDPRNESILVHIGGELLPRAQAKVSVFDSTVQGGDAVWEGLRVYDGRVFMLDRHIARLRASAKAMAFADIPEPAAVEAAVFETLNANGMRDGAHIRLTLSRGEKITSGMDPRLNEAGSCLIVPAEWKAPVYEQGGIRLVTSAIRRNSPQFVDSKIHHNNLINNILAKIEANVAGVDDALMLDVHGFVSETNATNVFVVRGGVLLTPWANACLPGITRPGARDRPRPRPLCRGAGPLPDGDLDRDEMFTTGTMGELAPVLECDGRTIGDGTVGPVTRQLQGWYAERTAKEGTPIPD